MELVLKNSIIGLCGVADMLGVLFWSVQSILKGGLDMCHTVSKFMLHVLIYMCQTVSKFMPPLLIDMCQTVCKFMPHLLSEEHEFVAETKKSVVPRRTFSD
jgi:hypothetical protein